MRVGVGLGGSEYRPLVVHHRKTVGSVLGKVWNLPNTIIGLAYGALGMALGAVLSVVWGAIRIGSIGYLGGVGWFGGGISIGNNSIQFTNNPLQPSAITLGNVIIYGRGEDFQPDSTRPGATLGEQEAQHTLQGEILGPLYLLSHLALGTAAMLADGYWHGPTNLLERGPHSYVPTPWW